MKWRPLIVVLLLGCSCSAWSSNDLSSKDHGFIDSAISKMDIFALPSFSMHARVEINSNGKPLEGSYELLWNGPDHWRETTTFPGYSESSIGGADGVVFLKRTTDFIPLRIFQMHAALGYGMAAGFGSFFHLELRPEETIDKIRDRKEHGSPVKCAEIEGRGKRRAICVEEANGTIVRQGPFLDEQVLPIGDKAYPRKLSYIEQGKPMAQVSVTDFKSPVQLPASVFVPPEGSHKERGCINPAPPSLVHRVNPSYPEQARRSYIQGTIYVDALIGKDGVPRGLRIVSGVTQSLNDASLDALRQWGYQPATCDGTPVDYETIITINYSLR